MLEREFVNKKRTSLARQNRSDFNDEDFTIEMHTYHRRNENFYKTVTETFEIINLLTN